MTVSLVRPRVLFYVQHLLGIGHLRRATTIAHAAHAAGLDVTLVSGGAPVPGLDTTGLEFVQLPPLRAADKNFKVLVDETGREIDDALRARRRDMLLEAFAATRPAIVLTELFPFGRRQLRFELMPMLEEAAGATWRPAIACSVRDILVQPPKPERIAEMLDLVKRQYDAVLVHGDPEVISFDETFPPAARIAAKLRYTGYVVEPPRAADPDGPGAGEVIVSAGGGAVSEELFRAAMAARPSTRLAEAPWRLLVGHALSDAIFDSLRREAEAGVIVERARADFTTLLANCALSISQGGYNTVMEVLAARTRGVVVPYAGGLETEQTLRARLLERSGVVRVVEERALSAGAIVDAAEAALDAPPAPVLAFKVHGAAETARQLLVLAGRRTTVAG